jgi:dTDP-4-amino-4,6-dideoxygalactose transaminase
VLFDEINYSHNFGHIGPLSFWGLGINAKISELQAAMGLAVLPSMSLILSARKDVVDGYDYLLNFDKIKKQKLRLDTDWNFSYYPVLFSDESQLLKTQKYLNDNDIFPRRYFYPSLDTLPYISGYSLQISRSIASRILCLPLYHNLEKSDIIRISDIVNKSLI